LFNPITSNSYLYSKNSFFKRFQIRSNLSVTNSVTWWFLLLQIYDFQRFKNEVPFPAGSLIGDHPKLKPLKINDEWLFSLSANSKSNIEIQVSGYHCGYQRHFLNLVPRKCWHVGSDRFEDLQSKGRVQQPKKIRL
jgi:hypothetical protein